MIVLACSRCVLCVRDYVDVVFSASVMCLLLARVLVIALLRCDRASVRVRVRVSVGVSVSVRVSDSVSVRVSVSV